MTEATSPVLSSLVGRVRSVRVNLLVNIFAQVWSLGLSLVIVPVYLHLLGIEAYGLIGFFATLQALVRIFDLGLSPTVIRQIARLATGSEHQETRDFFRTFEVVTLLFAGAVGLLITVGAPWIGRHWLNSQALSATTVVHAVVLMGLMCGVTWLGSYYQNVLFGFERHATLMLLNVAGMTLSVVGGWLLIALVSPSIVLLLAWQLGTSILCCSLGGCLAHRALPHVQSRTAFRAALLRQTWRIAAGMAGISITGLILTNLDKVFLSKMLSLAQFGDYTLATMAASAVITSMTIPGLNVMFPRFSALVAQKNEARLPDFYHACVQFMGAALVPAATILVLFSQPLLLIWTRKPAIAAAASGILAVVACSLTINGFMIPAYALQLAHAWTKIVIRLNLALVVIFIGALFVLLPKFGALGAAEALLVTNVAYLAIGLPITHRYLLPGHATAAILRDMVPVVAVCVIIGLILAVIGLPPSGALLRLCYITGAWLVLTACSAAVSSHIRDSIWRWLRSRQARP